MPDRVYVRGKDETGLGTTLFVDKYGKIRVGVVEYIQLIAQHVTTDKITIAATDYNHLLCFPLPLHSDEDGDDYTETTLTGTDGTVTGTTSATFLSVIENAMRIKGTAKGVVTIYYVTNIAEGTTTIDSIDVVLEKIDSAGSVTSITTKSVTVGYSTTTTAVTIGIPFILTNLDVSLNEGERLRLKITINYSLVVTAGYTATSTVRINHGRGSDSTNILLPVLM